MNNLVIITGPTSVGKTELSINLAKEINGEIISADSIQVYKNMNIGSAKITNDEMRGIKHYLMDILNPDQPFNVHVFQQMALKAIDEIYSKGKIPIIVGGTGFYIQSVLYNINFEETADDYSYRDELELIASEKGCEYIHNMLKEIDPISAKNIHPNNVKRVIRALEFYHETGKLISEHNEEQKQNQSPYNFAYLVLNDNRDALYNRINKRVDQMIDLGLENEVKSLLNMGYTRDLTSMEGIGYKEMVSYLLDEITFDEAVELIKKDTRHFAKRQLTWFKREKEATIINKNEFLYDESKILKHIINLLKEKKIVEE